MLSRLKDRSYISVAIGASMFVAGAAFTMLSTWMPHGPHGDVRGLRSMAVAELLCALMIVLFPRRWRHVIPLLVVFGAVAVVSVSVYFNGERLGDGPTMTEFFYAWPAVYVGYFFRRPLVPIFIVVTSASYAVALSAMDLNGNATIRWSLTTAVIAGLTIALHAIRTQVNGLVQRLNEAARTDSLTAIPNRRAFDEHLTLELERAARTGEPLALVVGDVDGFKALNDRLGHAAGDAALTAVGQVLTNECRAVDVPARIGGEEFAILLPGTAGEAAIITANRLRAAVSGIKDADGRPLTISFGVAEHPRDAKTSEDLMSAADRALYAAKEAGRDRAVLYEPVETTEDGRQKTDA